MGLDFFDAPDILWCKQLFNSLNDQGVWGVPRSGLTFQKRGEMLVLLERFPWAKDCPYSAEDWAKLQEEDYLEIKRRFEAAKIHVEEAEPIPDDEHVPQFLLSEIGDDPRSAFH